MTIAYDLDWTEEEDRTPITRTIGPARVLVAEDDPALRALVASCLYDDGFAVFEANSAPEAVAQLEQARISTLPEDRIDLMVIDHMMPGQTGMQLIEELHDAGRGIPTVLMTAFPSETVRAAARRLRVPLLAKPFSLATLSDVVVTMLLEQPGRPVFDEQP